MGDRPERVTTIVLAYGDEPLLSECVESVLASRHVSADVVLVDNGCLSPELEQVSRLAGVTVLRPERNLGFAAGANLGARVSTGEILAFVNSDAVVQPTTLHAFTKALQDPGVGLVTGSIRLMAQPDLMNSCGNPVHYTGVSWAGGMGTRATTHTQSREVASVSGASMACRREVWLTLGGFLEEMFAYHEDTELSLRCWQRGLRVLFVPDAIALHDYEFSRNSTKLGLLERNRLIILSTLYERRTLVVLAPALVVLEFLTAILSARQGWFKQKASGWRWLIRHRHWIKQRRREVQSARTIGDAQLLSHLTSDFDPGQQFGARIQSLVTSASRAYWTVAHRFIGE